MLTELVCAKSSITRGARIGVMLLVAVGWQQATFGAATFQPIYAQQVAALPGYLWFNPAISVSAISGDGSTIAGSITSTGVDYDCASFSCGVGSFVWSLEDESRRRQITTSTPLHYESWTRDAHPNYVTALSHNGQDALVISEYRHYETAIYRDGEPNLLRPNVADRKWLWGADMSSDGGVVVGNLGGAPIRWTRSTGLQSIDGLSGDYYYTATAVSGDGHVAVLNGQPGFTHDFSVLFSPNTRRGNAFQWTDQNGTIELTQLDGDDFSRAAASSFDGSMIVGSSIRISEEDSVPRDLAVRWEHGSVLQLETVNGYDSSIAADVSGDGKLVVGQVFNYVPYSPSLGDFPYQVNSLTHPNLLYVVQSAGLATLWNAAGQAFDLHHFLSTRYGLSAELDGWQLLKARLISDDGRVISGHGIDPQGNAAIWVAVLPIPEPHSLWLITAAVIVLACQRGGRVRTGCSLFVQIS